MSYLCAEIMCDYVQSEGILATKKPAHEGDEPEGVQEEGVILFLIHHS